MNIKMWWAGGVVAIIVTGCASDKELKDVSRVTPKEAVAVMRFHIERNGKEVKNAAVLFNAPATGIPKYDYRIQEDGYVFAKLPVGDNSINYVLHPDGLSQHHFKDGELTFRLEEGQAVYYVGDITMHWQGRGSSANWALASLVGVLTAGPGMIAGPLAGGAASQGKILVGVESKKAEAQEAFRRAHPNGQEIKESLLRVNPSSRK